MKKNLTDTEESFRERVELRRYNLEKEIGREAEKVRVQMEALLLETKRLGSSHKGFSLGVTDPFVLALRSRIKGPATRGYSPPLDGVPIRGRLKTFEVQVLSAATGGTIAVEIEYVPGPVSRLQSIGGGGGHVPMVGVPGSKLLYLQGLRQGAADGQRIHVLARQRGAFEYTNQDGENRIVERWHFIRFVNE
jgi:hypothetical protein